jgi:hypothetical protein
MRTRVIPLTGLLAIAGLLTLLDGGKGRSQQQAPVPDFLKKVQAQAGPEDLLREILVTPQAGPWMICLASYTGPEAAQMARDFVMVLRDPAGPYKMNDKVKAYVFNRGDDERIKERLRIEQYKQQMREKYKQIGLDVPPKVRVPRMMHIEDQCAVLVGEFKDMASARRYLDVLRKFDTPDPNKVKMDAAYIADPKNKKGEVAYINPFRNGFVVPNPTIPQQAANQNAAPDPLLKDLNAGESYSLLKCPRPYTLLVKQYQGAALVQSDSGGGGVLGKVGLGKGGVNGETLNAAGQSAHNLAELLQKKGFKEVYVLHTRYNSMVTVGSFADEKDNRLRHTQDMWARFQQQLPPDLLARMQLLTQPVPMIVPRFQ